MLKNVVFDMGKVLIDYDPMLVCRRHLSGEEEAKRVCDALFISPEWVLLDMGLMSEERAMQNILPRLPEELREKTILCMRDWDIYNMSVKEDMALLAKEWKEEGYKLYVCSNASARLPLIYKRVLPYWEIFDGILFSAELGCMKPQKQMYELFFARFGIKPEESFFIDDLDINIEGARKLGMQGYIYCGDTEALREHFAALTGKEPK